MELIINFTNSLLYNIIGQILALIFYILLVTYIFSKIYIILLVRKLNCRSKYNQKIKEIKENSYAHFKKIGKYILILFACCIISAFLILFALILIFIFSGFGTALAFSNSAIIIFMKNLFNILLNLLGYIPLIAFCLIPTLFYGLIYSFLINGIWLNISVKKLILTKDR